MCGICGFVGERDPGMLAAMTAALSHRGPDDESSFTSDTASLGARRLSIVDVPHGRQPMVNEDGSVVVAFNGEIYNAGALRRQLISRGHRIHTHCDTEVIPHLYEECGDGFVHVLNGQFAIAIWDAGTRRLLLTRDRVGIKPLFYVEHKGRLLFGSEIKSILRGMRHRPPICLEAFYHYLSFKCVPAPLTIYQGVVAVLPGEQVAFHEGRISRTRYWEFDCARCEIQNERAIADRLEELLVQSVRRRLIADVPVGAMLSGGVDSSLLVALATEMVDRPIQTFTLGFTDDFAHKQREVEAARAVARQFGTEHHEHVISHRELLDDLPAVLGAFDEPFAGVMSPFFLHKLVRRHVKVCLSGDGADELFGSYLAHRLAQPVNNLLTYGESVVRERPELVAPFENDLDRVIGIAHAQDWAWRASLLVFSDEEKRALFNPDYVAFSAFNTTALVRNMFAECRARDVQNRQQDYDCRTLLPDLVLNFTDKLAMAHSVETRVPFLDHELVEFAASLPGDLKIRRGCCKWILKEVARRRLPREIVDRPKEGFVMPINAWQGNVLRAAIEEALAPERLAEHGFFRNREVGRLLQRYYAGQTDLQYKVWALFCFQAWYEHGAATETIAPTKTESCTPTAMRPADRSPDPASGGDGRPGQLPAVIEGEVGVAHTAKRSAVVTSVADYVEPTVAGAC